jgi:hypothetical protein
MDTQHNNLNKKLDRLINEQQRSNKTNNNHPLNRQHDQFYPRTVNLTDIKFTNEEMELINNSLQYRIEKPIEKYWNYLIMETEQAIGKLDVKILATKKLKQINVSSSQHNA